MKADRRLEMLTGSVLVAEDVGGDEAHEVGDGDADGGEEQPAVLVGDVLRSMSARNAWFMGKERSLTLLYLEMMGKRVSQYLKISRAWWEKSQTDHTSNNTDGALVPQVIMKQA